MNNNAHEPAAVTREPMDPVIEAQVRAAAFAAFTLLNNLHEPVKWNGLEELVKVSMMGSFESPEKIGLYVAATARSFAYGNPLDAD